MRRAVAATPGGHRNTAPSADCREGSAGRRRRTSVKTIVAALLFAVPIAAFGALAVGGTSQPRPRTEAEFFCVFSKSVSVGGQTVTTPTVCVPAP